MDAHITMHTNKDKHKVDIVQADTLPQTFFTVKEKITKQLQTDTLASNKRLLTCRGLTDLLCLWEKECIVRTNKNRYIVDLSSSNYEIICHTLISVRHITVTCF